MDFEYKVTVFTPTYNRAYIIENLYRSLQKQTCMEFEWLVVDDGSSDNTQQLFESWISENNPFPIRYYRQENGGKCSAINRGLELAMGELFFTMDSDDTLTDDALEKIVAWERELPKDGNFCGFAANGVSDDRAATVISGQDYFDGNAFDMYGKMGGEKAIIFYTEIHRRYPYPIFPGERFMTEAVTWNRMAWDGYRMRYFNDVIWIWEYKPDGLTKSGYQIFIDNPQGTGLFFREKAIFFDYDLKTKLGMWYGFACDCFGRCTNAQIAEYIHMPRWLVQPMKLAHRLRQFLKKR